MHWQPMPAPIVLAGAQAHLMADPTPLPPRKGSSLWLTAFLDLLFTGQGREAKNGTVPPGWVSCCHVNHYTPN